MMPDETRARAVLLVAAGTLTHDEIAEDLGIGRSTLSLWKADPEFREQVQSLRQRVYDEVIEGGVGDLKMRVIAKNDRWRRLLKTMEARAKDPAIRDVPGGEYGLVVRRERTIHTGKDEYERVIEHEFDKALWDALGSVEQEAATELGQWKSKVEHSIDEPTRKLALELSKAYTLEQLDAIEQRILQLSQAQAQPEKP
jgi:hypothetical protein